MALKGSCLCGGVRYEIRGALLPLGHCHCSMCRKTHGAAFGTYAGAKQSEFHWTAGEELLSKYPSSEGRVRYFCSRCGSPLVSVTTADPELVEVTMGTLDDDGGVRPAGHIFVGSKAPWHEITDSLPQFEEWPPGMGPRGRS